MAVGKREWVDGAIDKLQFRLDRLPSMDYQPLPWLGIRDAARSEGTVSRWRSISQTIHGLELRSAVDIGCNVGYYVISLAGQRVPTTGIEGDRRFFRMFLHAVQALGLENVGCLYASLSPDNLEIVPAADCILFLSVWHHFVRYFGIDAATEMLRTIWSRSRVILFFETGASEMPASFGLPDMGSDPTAFLLTYLSSTCSDATIVNLGRHVAFAADHSPCERDLFALTRS